MNLKHSIIVVSVLLVLMGVQKVWTHYYPTPKNIRYAHLQLEDIPLRDNPSKKFIKIKCKSPSIETVCYELKSKSSTVSVVDLIYQNKKLKKVSYTLSYPDDLDQKKVETYFSIR